MLLVILTALGVGGATMLGVAVGFRFQKISVRMNNRILSLGAGIMLAAAILGLILPSFEDGNLWDLLLTVMGIFAGAIALSQLDRLVPKINQLLGAAKHSSCISRGILFVIAIAIHNIPEGLAAGIGFGCEDLTQALMIAGSIAFQNIPEGMVIVAPMLAAGISKKRTLICALSTGLIEIIGVLIGYTAIQISTSILPFSLAFAGGTMLYVIIDELIPQTHNDSEKRDATYAALFGFCLMLLFDVLL